MSFVVYGNSFEDLYQALKEEIFLPPTLGIYTVHFTDPKGRQPEIFKAMLRKSMV